MLWDFVLHEIFYKTKLFSKSKLICYFDKENKSFISEAYNFSNQI